MKTKIISFILAAVMLLSLTACGEKPEKPEEADEPEKEQVKQEEIKEPQEEKPDYRWGGDGSVRGLKTWAEKKQPEAVLGIAYIGRYEGTGGSPLNEEIESEGYFPFVEANFYNLLYESPEGGNDIVCFLPIDGSSKISIFEKRKDSDEKPDKVSISSHHDYNDPIFYLCDLDESVISAAVVDKEGKRTDYKIKLDGNRDFVLPDNGEVLDFTVHKESPVTKWRVSGKWESVQQVPEAGGYLRHRFWLDPEGYMLFISMSSAKIAAVAYEGKWTFSDGIIDLQYYPIFEPDEVQNVKLRPVFGDEGSVTMNAYEGKAEFFGNEDAGRKFISHRYFEDIGMEYDLYQSAVSKASVYYDYMNGRKADKAEIIGFEQDGMLVYLYDLIGGERVSRAWYVIDVYSKSGRNYLTGESLDLSRFDIQEEKAGSVFTVMEDGTLSLYFAEDQMLEYYTQGKIAAGREYTVKGVTPYHTKAYVGEIGLDFVPFIFLLDDDGRVYYCNVVEGGLNESFELSEPLQGLKGIVGFENDIVSDDSGNAGEVYAVSETGEKTGLTSYIRQAS